MKGNIQAYQIQAEQAVGVYLFQTGKPQPQAEQAFGIFRFQIGKPLLGSKGGRPTKYVLLTEEQAEQAFSSLRFKNGVEYSGFKPEKPKPRQSKRLE